MLASWSSCLLKYLLIRAHVSIIESFIIDSCAASPSDKSNSIGYLMPAFLQWEFFQGLSAPHKEIYIYTSSEKIQKAEKLRFIAWTFWSFNWKFSSFLTIWVEKKVCSDYFIYLDKDALISWNLIFSTQNPLIR